MLRRYRKCALSVHPDKNGHAQAEQAFKALGQAYEALRSEEKCRPPSRPAAASRTEAHVALGAMLLSSRHCSVRVGNAPSSQSRLESPPKAAHRAHSRYPRPVAAAPARLLAIHSVSLLTESF